MTQQRYAVRVTATRLVEVCAENPEDAQSEALYEKWGWREEGWDDFTTEVESHDEDSSCDEDDDDDEEQDDE